MRCTNGTISAAVATVLSMLLPAMTMADDPELDQAIARYQAFVQSHQSAPTTSDRLQSQRATSILELLDEVLENPALRASHLGMADEEIPRHLLLGSTSAFALADDDGGLGNAAEKAPEKAPEEDTGDDATGTDPRGFSHKLMPYYLYTHIKNDIEINQLNLFFMYAFNPNVAMTVDIPVVKHIDYSDFGPFKTGTGGFPPGQGGPGLPNGGVPLSDLDSDGDNTGVGDLNLRLFAKVGLDGRIDEENTWMIMPVIETTIPTASDDVLGGEAWIGSPGVTLVIDIPGDAPFGLGFIAMMNFYDFDLVKDDSRGKTRRFRGRWFWMQPLTPPDMGALGGFYILTEFQPIYDFQTDDFDLWIGPEFGKIMKPGWIIYAKPGFGIDPDPEDRQYTLEIGTRKFF